MRGRGGELRKNYLGGVPPLNTELLQRRKSRTKRVHIGNISYGTLLEQKVNKTRTQVGGCCCYVLYMCQHNVHDMFMACSIFVLDEIRAPHIFPYLLPYYISLYPLCVTGIIRVFFLLFPAPINSIYAFLLDNNSKGLYMRVIF